MSAWDRFVRATGSVALFFMMVASFAVAPAAGAQETTGSLTISLTDNSGAALGGACFSVTDAAGGVFSVCDDDSDGITQLDDLAEGEAAIVQTSGPDGFELSPSSTVTIVAGAVATAVLTNSASPVPTSMPSEEPTEIPLTPTETSTAESTFEPTELATSAGTPTLPIETPEPTTETSEGTPADAVSQPDDQFSIAAELEAISFTIQVFQSTTTDQSSSYVLVPSGGSVTANHWVYAVASFVGATTPPTGTVDIALTQSTNCVGGDIAGWSPVIAPDGSIPATPPVQISATGIYNFNARYLGDATHSATFSDCGIASFTIGYGAPPTHAITLVDDDNAFDDPIRPGSTIVAGTEVRVDDRLSPIVTTPSGFYGNVTFRMYQGSDCTGPAAITTSRVSVPSLGASTVSSIPFGMTAEGTFSFQAYYYGTTDAPNAPSYSACIGPLTVIKASPTVDLSAIPATLSVSETGSTQVILRRSSSPTGTISYTLFAGGACDGEVIQSFGPFGFVGSGPVGIPSPTYQFNQAGAYSWSAGYSGDEGNNAATSNCAAVQVLAPSLAISKSSSSETVVYGDPLSFTLNVVNNGQGTALGVSLTDSLSDGYSWTVDPSTSGLSCGISSGAPVLTCTAESLGSSGQAMVKVNGIAGNQGCGDIGNFGSVAATNNAEVDSNIVYVHIQCGDLAVLKIADDDTVAPGESIEFTIETHDYGDAGIYGVVVTDDLGAFIPGLTWTIDSQDEGGTCAIANNILTCNWGNLNPIDIRSVHISSTPVPNDVCGEWTNYATGQAADEKNGVEGNNYQQSTITVVCPDLSITKSAVPESVSAGTGAVFTIQVTNTGDADAESVAVTDSLPPGLDWVENSDDCAIGNGTMTCTIASLAPQASMSVQLSATTDLGDCGDYENTATVSAANEPSAAIENNGSSATISVTCPDLSIEKSAEMSTITVGDSAVFTIEVSNDGDGPADSVTVTDTLPDSIGWYSSNSDCNVIDGVLTCDFGTLEPGETRPVTVTGPTSIDDCGTLENTAVVSSPSEPEDRLSDNTSSASINVLCAGLNYLKIPDEASVSAGDDIGYTITIMNTGDGNAIDTVMSDPLPTNPGLSWSIESTSLENVCEIVDGSVECAFGTMTPETMVFVHIVSPTTPATCGTVSNIAYIDAANTATGAAFGDILVNCPDIALAKTADASTITVGDTIGFTIVVSNEGDGAASDVTAADTLSDEVEWTLDGADAEDCGIAGGVLSCDFGVVPAGGSRTVHISGTAGGEDCGEISNTASAAAENEAESDLGNNSATASVIITCADIEINKTGDDGDGGVVPLEGACFELLIGDVSFAEECSDADGHIEFANIPVRTYTLRETSAPENYEVSESWATIELEPGDTETLDINDALETVDIPVFAITCASDPGAVFAVDIAIGTLPAGCSVVPGVNFTVTIDGGTPQSFTTGANGGFIMTATLFSTVVVTEDFNTVPGGFEPAFDQSLLTKTIESVQPDQPGLVFVSVALPPTATPTPEPTQTPTPTPEPTQTPTPGPTNTPAPTAAAPEVTPTSVAVTQLPSTGSGPGGVSGSWLFVLALLSIGLVFALAARSRRSPQQ